jgi:hypothetical protein
MDFHQQARRQGAVSEGLDDIAAELDGLISDAWAEIYAALDACGSPTPARMPPELANLLHRLDLLAFRLRQIAEQTTGN